MKIPKIGVVVVRRYVETQTEDHYDIEVGLINSQTRIDDSTAVEGKIYFEDYKSHKRFVDSVFLSLMNK